MKNLSHEAWWLAEHPEEISKYMGEWIAIVDEEVIAHGRDLEELHKKVKKLKTRPLFHYVIPDECIAYVYRISLS